MTGQSPNAVLLNLYQTSGTLTNWFTKREEKFTRNVFWMMLDDYDTTKTFLIGRARVDHVPHYAAGI